MRYKEFATEALAPSEYRPLVKGWDKTKYAELFGGQYRIYIPLETPEPVSKTVKINPQVKQEVEKLGYTIEDYIKGIAVKTENGRVRQIKIGKLLSPATAQIFANDPVRGATRQSKKLVVISRHPYDIAGMSTDRGWSSCMNLRKDRNNKHFVPLDIKAGSVVAYLINAKDKNITSPQARMLIKPFVNILGNHEVAFGIEDAVYGTAPPEFVKTVSDWVDKVNASRQLNGIFQLDPSVYPEITNKQKFIGKDKETWLNSIDESDQVSILKKDPMLIQYIKNPSEPVQVAAVETNGRVITYIIAAGITPSERVQLAAVSNGDVIRDIIKAGIIPSETVQVAAVSKNWYTIEYIIKAGIKPSETVQVAAVTKAGHLIDDIIKAGIKPSETVQIAAVTETPRAIQYILHAGIKPSETVQIAAVSSNNGALDFIIHNGIKPSEDVQVAAVTKYPKHSLDVIFKAKITPSERVQRAAVTKDPHMIAYIIQAGIKPSETVQVAAVSEFGNIIKYIIQAGIKPSETVQVAAVTSVARHVDAIKVIIDAGITLSERVQRAAVTKDPHMIAYIIQAGITPSEEVQLAAVEQDGLAIYFISNLAKITPSEAVQLAAVSSSSDSKIIESVIDFLTRAGITPSHAVMKAAKEAGQT